MSKKFIVLTFFVVRLFATTAQWTGTTSNVWNLPTNWNPNTPPILSGDIANLTNAAPSQTTITLNNESIILTQLNLDIGTSYTINPGGGSGGFTFSGSGASINVTTTNGNGSYTLNTPISVGASLDIVQNSTGTLTFAGVLSGTSNITLDGTGTLVLSANNAATYSGQFTIDTGTISIAADNNLGAAGTNTNIVNGSLLYTMSETTSRPFTLSGSASIQVAAGQVVTLNGVISGSGSLTKSNSGTLTLGATNTYQGGTTISGGTLIISSDANLGNSAGSLNIGTASLLILGEGTIARSGSIFGSAGIISGGNNTFSGSFSGAGNATFSGGGTFTLTGANSYSGGTFIAANTQLAGTTNGLQGNITLNAATSLLTFSQNFDGTYSGVIVGPLNSQLTKLGTGALTFTGTSPSFLGTTSIHEGTLVVNGSLAGSPVTVQSGGTLSGTGTVGNTLNQGLLDPGQGTSVGTLNINGTLSYAGGSTNISIAPLTSDRLAVSGTATLSGPLQIEPTPAFYGFSASYTILTSAGLAGTFSPVTSTNSAFAPTVSYVGNNVLLQVVISAPFAAFPFSNQNTAAVGQNIDAIYAAGQLSSDLFNVVNTFVGQSNSTINAALDQMHPAQYSAFTEMQAEVNGQLISLFHRLPYLPCSCNNPNRLWIEGLGNSLTVKNHGIELGFQANTGGIAFGYDGQVTDSLVLGFGGAWTNNSLEWQRHRGSGTMNGLYGSVYFDSQVGGFYFGGALLGGMDFYDASRHIEFITTNRTAQSDFQALDLMGQISTAYLFGSPQAFFYPYANLDYLYLHTYSFSETGASGLNLNVFGRTDQTFRTELGLGLQVQDRNATETMCISPLISLGWVNMCPISRPKLKSTFEGASIPYEVVGWDESWNLFNINFGLTIGYYCYSLMLDYNVEFSPDSDTTLFNQHGNVRFDWKW